MPAKCESGRTAWKWIDVDGSPAIGRRRAGNHDIFAELWPRVSLGSRRDREGQARPRPPLRGEVARRGVRSFARRGLRHFVRRELRSLFRRGLRSCAGRGLRSCAGRGLRSCAGRRLRGCARRRLRSCARRAGSRCRRRRCRLASLVDPGSRQRRHSPGGPERDLLVLHEQQGRGPPTHLHSLAQRRGRAVLGEHRGAARCRRRTARQPGAVFRMDPHTSRT